MTATKTKTRFFSEINTLFKKKISQTKSYFLNKTNLFSDFLLHSTLWLGQIFDLCLGVSLKPTKPSFYWIIHKFSKAVLNLFDSCLWWYAIINLVVRKIKNIFNVNFGEKCFIGLTFMLGRTSNMPKTTCYTIKTMVGKLCHRTKVKETWEYK